MSKRETAIVICPGRGTYNAAELGYLQKHHSQKKDFIAALDAVRADKGQTSISVLDGAKKFKLSQHGTGDNASLLIYGCAVADYLDVAERFDVLAVTGNSLGWYLALACGGALSLAQGAYLVNEMGGLMHEQGTGGQIVYPLVDENWQVDPGKEQLVNTVLQKAANQPDMQVSVSIRLGGLLVFAADEAGLGFLMKVLPPEGRYPMKLLNHAAFHSPLLDHILPAAQARLPASLFNKPTTPLVDGRGVVWSPYSTDVAALYAYTLGAQLNSTYDFAKAVAVAVQEFAPDRVIVTGPGTTMGAPVAQELIRQRWHGLKNKADFKKNQAQTPYVLSLGIEEQRKIALD